VVAGTSLLPKVEAEANARRLALCWNMHDELVAALAALLDEWDSRTAMLEPYEYTRAELKAETTARNILFKARASV